MVWALCYLPYIILYFIAEKVVTGDYYVSYLPVDDLIPFCEWFIFAYVLWFPFLAVGAFAALSDKKAFRRQMLFVGISFSLTLIFDMIFPNGQDLRPVLSGDLNVAERLCAGIYAADTNTNVLPSMHILGAFAVVGSYLSSEKLRKRKITVLLIILSVVISASTVLVKQHSMLDVIWGAVAGTAMTVLTYVIPGIIDKKRGTRS
ncbi:MAG: phosphatase PAP2 family protein [Clostridia bacterium]|nr:phosphatase PAP2 family protein [Clostridia bacterium]